MISQTHSRRILPPLEETTTAVVRKEVTTYAGELFFHAFVLVFFSEGPVSLRSLQLIWSPPNLAVLNFTEIVEAGPYAVLVTGNILSCA